MINRFENVIGEVLFSVKNCSLLLFLAIIGTFQLQAQPLNNHLIFDGSDDYISLNNMDVSGNAITLEALINSSDLSNCQYSDCRIISKAEGLSTPDHYWMLSTNNSGANTVLRFRLKTNGNSTTLVATTGALSENTWYHVAATYDGAMMRLFLDGTEVGSTAKTGTLTTNSAVGAFIGANPPVIDNPWKGEIDEVRIWNTARTQAQIQANGSSELTGNEAGLQAYYQFNEGSGQTINDQAGNNNTVLGSTSIADSNDPNFANSNPPNPIDLKVLLEGSYDPSANEMMNALETRNLIPINQPFNQAPWYYNGNETKVIAQVSDWVLVSFRTEIDGNSEVGRAAGLVQLDGQIHFPSTNVLPSSLNTPVYIVIETRNHLTIMSPQPVAVNNGMLTYDFTVADSYKGGGRGQKQLSNGKWSMFSGDINNDLDINGADRVLWAAANGSFGAYLQEDLNLDGDVNGNDKIYWDLNNGVFSTVPKSDTLRTNAVFSCPAPNFVLNNCNYTVNWIHDNPLSTTVNYDLRINGIDPGLSVVYPATSNSIDICNTLGLNSGTGTLNIELLYWYDGDVTNQLSAGTCPVDYDLGTTNSQCMTYAQIRAAGRPENCYDLNTADAHLAEFLYMNPTVSNWTIDEATEVICAIDAPEPSAASIFAPAPSGGNDAPALEAFFNANPGAEIKGTGGIYKIGSTIDIDNPVTLWDFPSELIGSVGTVYRVRAPNVEFYRSPIDAKNRPSTYTGWRVENGADNFVLSTSGISNIWHKSGISGAGVFIRGANNFRITCNVFKNLINDTSDKTLSAIMRTVWNANYSNIPSGQGYIANNISENVQSNGKLYDGEFFCSQGFTGSAGIVRIIANRCVNSGKRLTKWQHPDGFVASNFWHLRDRQGPLGIRKNTAAVNCQLDADNITAVNNRIKMETNGEWGTAFRANCEYNNYTYTNLHFNCNDIEILIPPPASYYSFGIHFHNKDSNSADTRNKLVNCSVKDNVFRGTGGLNHVFAFDAGYIDNATGLDIDLSGNTVTTPVLISVFRGSNSPLP